MCLAVEGCDVDPTWRICKKHASRLRRTGTLEAKPWHRRGICSVEDCLAREAESGMCKKHRARFVRHGDPETVLKRGNPPGTYRQEFVNYGSAHNRVEVLRGKANQHFCIDCGVVAQHWSYTHADPNEVVETRNGYTLPYSLSPAYYVPRCISCHKKFDLGLDSTSTTD